MNQPITDVERNAFRSTGLSIIHAMVEMGANEERPLDFLHNMLVLHFRLRSKVRVASANLSVAEIERMFANAFPYNKYVVPFRKRYSNSTLCVKLMACYDSIPTNYVSIERFQEIASEIGKYHAQWQSLVAISQELETANQANVHAAAI